MSLSDAFPHLFLPFSVYWPVLTPYLIRNYKPVNLAAKEQRKFSGSIYTKKIMSPFFVALDCYNYLVITL